MVRMMEVGLDGPVYAVERNHEAVVVYVWLFFFGASRWRFFKVLLESFSGIFGPHSDFAGT